jgi:hypothetical protein
MGLEHVCGSISRTTPKYRDEGITNDIGYLAITCPYPERWMLPERRNGERTIPPVVSAEPFHLPFPL